MKRWLWLILLGSLAALLVGCGRAATNNVTNAGEVQRIDPQEAKALADKGEATLYDTRSAEAYRSLHAAGAVSFPEEDLAANFDKLPNDDKALIFY